MKFPQLSTQTCLAPLLQFPNVYSFFKIKQMCY